MIMRNIVDIRSIVPIKSNKPLPLSEIAPLMMSDDISKIRKNRISLLSKQDQSIFELLIKISVKDEL